MNSAIPRPLVGLGVAIVLLGAILAPAVAAQESTTTAPPPPESSTTTAPDDSTTTVDPATTTDPGEATTVPPDGSEDLSQESDDELVGRGFYASQGAFDPASKQGIPAEVARARREQASAAGRLRTAEGVLADARQAADSLQAELALLEEGERQALDAATKAKSAFVDRAISAYMNGRESQSFAMLDARNPMEYARRTEMLSAVLDRDADVAADYQRKREALTDDLQQRLDQVDEATRAVENASVEEFTAKTVAQAADWQLRTFQNNSHVWIPGFVFPVAGPVQFVDSFGYPRLVGSGQQHWHEGCDVMAAGGTPLVAVEDGVLTKVGENSLGGLSLKITGTSGYWFYYAHLSAFAPGLVEGQPIAAGTVVGYVGNTGDAQGGPTHLHFEVHPPKGKVIDSFGLLKSAWQARQEQYGLGGIDPVSPPDPASHPDPGMPGGFPRFLDGRPVYADPTEQPPFDPLAPVAPTVSTTVPVR